MRYDYDDDAYKTLKLKHPEVKRSALCLMDSDGKHARRILEWPRVYRKTWKQHSMILGAAWLPDSGTLLVDIRRGSDRRDTWVMAVDGEIHQIIENVGVVRSTTSGRKHIIVTAALHVLSEGALWLVTLGG